MKKRITVDIFQTILPKKNLNADLATIAPIAGITGGDVYYY